MNPKNVIQILGFKPKENTTGIFHKVYPNLDNYEIQVDFEKEYFNFGDKIKAESKTTQNFSQTENWVVFECVNRLLEKGYPPKNITLEKTWATGHGTSGRLDILVSRDDGSAYLMIECKTWGNEFDKELKNLEKNGGQLFTYFQQDKNTDILMLYTSAIDKTEVSYKNFIVKIEDDYRQTGNVKDFYERWNKLPKTNGIFENWVAPYEYQSKALTKRDLKVLKQEDSSFIFNRFLEILRHNVVSDKPNAFNKIFTLFLCKIVDENRNEDEQLHFQWIEGEDNHISFQKRLTDLYRRGMKELLEKQVTDVSDSEFDVRFQQIEDKYRSEIKDIFTELRLKKNNEFAIKEVYDDDSFNENAKVVKEIVELLQVYQLRYNYRQQFLSDFFELLLTTGLKQESGQFFTPVPIARFILRSIPINDITERKLQEGNKHDLLPLIIDYAAGSGHFVTESMEDVQKYIDSLDESNYAPATKRAVKKWKDDQFDWAEDYVYAIEKDYRLVKTAKVSCYLHGDGLAKVIHGDGLGDFATSKEFKDLLTITDKTYPQDNKQFDLVVSNPPYSVSAFKGTMMEEGKAKTAFDLYSRLTDQSSEIECLFIERTKQLLKDGGIAGIILPSSILSNSGIYSQTREIIFKYFEIIAITELGNNTFMATGTNTVILFLRRRNNADWVNIRALVDKFAINQQDVTINGIENPVNKYVNHVWEGIAFSDYLTLIKKQPNKIIEEHELYKEYHKKIKGKTEQEKVNTILNIELDKLFYFILAYPQRIVLVKSGEKEAEKQFLGYEFSYRRGSEGIHPVQRSKSIDECTRLYDADSFDNPEKASTYIYKTFKGEPDFEIPETLQKNISQQDLVDMMTFDRVIFEAQINLNSSKKVKFKSRFDLVTIDSIATFQSGLWKGKKEPLKLTKVIRNTNFLLNNGKLDYTDVEELLVEENQLKVRILEYGDIIIEKSGGSETQAIGRVVIFDRKDNEVYSYSNFCTRLRVNYDNANPFYVWFLLNLFYKKGGTIPLQNGVRLLNIDLEGYKRIKIPLPPKNIQDKIVDEIGLLEKKETEFKKNIAEYNEQIISLISADDKNNSLKKLGEVCEMKAGQFVSASEISSNNGSDLYPCYGGNGLRGYTKTITHQGKYPLIGRQGALCGNVHLVDGAFHATEHAVVVSPNEDINVIWLYYKLIDLNLNQYATGRAQPGLSVQNLKNVNVSIPSLDTQKQIVREIEKIEKNISELKRELEQLPTQKEMILKKYLE